MAERIAVPTMNIGFHSFQMAIIRNRQTQQSSRGKVKEIEELVIWFWIGLRISYCSSILVVDLSFLLYGITLPVQNAHFKARTCTDQIQGLPWQRRTFESSNQ